MPNSFSDVSILGPIPLICLRLSAPPVRGVGIDAGLGGADLAAAGPGFGAGLPAGAATRGGAGSSATDAASRAAGVMVRRERKGASAPVAAWGAATALTWRVPRPAYRMRRAA